MMSDHDLRARLAMVRSIALVGASAQPVRPSHTVMAYLLSVGFRVYPVNPALAGQDLLGSEVYASLADIPHPVDLVDVFRRPAALPAVTAAALALEPRPKLIWFQLGLTHPEAEAAAKAAGLGVIADRCLKIEHQRLFG